MHNFFSQFSYKFIYSISVLWHTRYYFTYTAVGTIMVRGTQDHPHFPIHSLSTCIRQGSNNQISGFISGCATMS